MPKFSVFIPVLKPVSKYCSQEKIIVEADNSDSAIKAAKLEAKGRGLEPADTIIDRIFRTKITPFAVEHGSHSDYPIEIDFWNWAKEKGLDLPCEEETGYCVSSMQRRYDREGNLITKKNYWNWENEIATPAILFYGYEEVWPWVSEEADSFGPLSRQYLVKKDGKFYKFWYG